MDAIGIATPEELAREARELEMLPAYAYGAFFNLSDDVARRSFATRSEECRVGWRRVVARITEERANG